MRRVVRSLLMYLLMWALPIQGMAAVSMQHCAAMHERMQRVSTAASMEGLEHEHGRGAAHEHHGDAAADQGVSVSAPDTHTSTCSACAACCSALGLPASAIRVPSALPDVPVVQLPLCDVDSFIPDGLDRPPRRFLA